MESAFGIIAEPNRRAILSLLASSERSVSEIEHQLRMPQPSVSETPALLKREWTHSDASTGSGLNRSRRSMLGWLPSGVSGPTTSTRSNATSIAWNRCPPEKERNDEQS
jgi:hypothetical protein